MFDRIGQQLNKFFLGAIVILLAIVFASQFGPQQEGCVSEGGASHAAEVYGKTITRGDFEAALRLASYALTRGAVQLPSETAESLDLRRHVLNGLIERRLLAREAEKIGFTVSGEDVAKRLVDEQIALVSMGIDAPPNLAGGEVFLMHARDEDDKFDREAAERFIQNGLRRSDAEFQEWQVEETLAQRMRDTVISTAQVSPREVWDAFVRERETADIEYIRFFPRYYRDVIEPTREEVSAWMAENSAAVDAEYASRRADYENLEKQVRARRILVRLEEGASEEVSTAARTRAEGILARAQAGDDFASLSRRYSDNVDEGRKGGDLGWAAHGAQPTAIDEALFAMQPDEVRLVEGERGFHILKLIEIREGTIAEDAAKLEIAERLYRDAKAEEMARNAAAEALTALRNGDPVEAVAARARGEEPPAAQENEDGEDGEDGEENAEDDAPDSPADPLAPTNREPDPYAPHEDTSGAFARSDVPIGGVDNAPLLAIVFDDLSEDARVPDAPIQLGNDFFAVRLKERQRAARDDFSADVERRLTDELMRPKQHEVLGIYIRELRRTAEESNDIEIDETVLRYDLVDGEVPEGSEDEPEESSESSSSSSENE
jgi:peptidyl-prolyl cis-trans isomerase D